MNDETKLEKIENLDEIVRTCDLNMIITSYKVLNDFVTQSILAFAIKKGRNEEIQEKDLENFKSKLIEIESLITKLLNFK